jgi:hypothetical protein
MKIRIRWVCINRHNGGSWSDGRMDRAVGTYVQREREREKGREKTQLLDIIPGRIVLRVFITVSIGHVRTSMIGDCCIMSVYKRRRERVPMSTPKGG